jgi:hypothetical protein
MTAATPPGRALAAWHTALSGRRPLRLWFATLLVHRVEALAVCARTHPLDPLRRAALARVAATPDAPCNGLDTDTQVAYRLLRVLEAEGLLARPGGRPALTPSGAAALREGAWELRWEERREFAAVDNSPSQRPPSFLPLRPGGRTPTPAAVLAFDPHLLAEWAGQPVPWKTRHGFPPEVVGVRLLPAVDPAGPDAWRRVVVSRAQCVALLLAEVAVGGDVTGLLGFRVDPDGWRLEGDSPAVVLGAAWPEALPELRDAPPPEAWRRAWEDWARDRGLLPEEAGACRLEPAGARLRVEAPPQLAGKVRASHPEVVKGEAWLLAGEGRARAAACLELRERPGGNAGR